MNGLLQLQRKGEPWQEYNFTYGAGFMRGAGYTKGWCRACGKWKLFKIDEVETIVERLFAIGVPTPMMFNNGAHYYGTCTNGHSGRFDPWTRPEPKRWKRDITKFEINRRDAFGKETYLVWLSGFKDPRREAHFQLGHECDRDCPEYDWDWEDW